MGVADGAGPAVHRIAVPPCCGLLRSQNATIMGVGHAKRIVSGRLAWSVV